MSTQEILPLRARVERRPKLIFVLVLILAALHKAKTPPLHLLIST